MKVAILNCDQVNEALAIRHGQYPHMFARLFQSPDPLMSLTTYNALLGELPKDINAADAYLITGSRHGVNDASPWIALLEEFVRTLHQAQKKVIGICFGHQLIAKALGGEVRKSSKGWGIGVLNTQVLCHQSWMVPVKNQFHLLASHQDQVEALPPGAKLLAGSDFCPNYMMQVGNNFLSLQGHPEFTKAYAQDLINSRAQTIDKAVIEAGLTSLSLEHNQSLITHWMINFLNYHSE